MDELKKAVQVARDELVRQRRDDQEQRARLEQVVAESRDEQRRLAEAAQHAAVALSSAGVRTQRRKFDNPSYFEMLTGRGHENGWTIVDFAVGGHDGRSPVSGCFLGTDGTVYEVNIGRGVHNRRLGSAATATIEQLGRLLVAHGVQL